MRIALFCQDNLACLRTLLYTISEGGKYSKKSSRIWQRCVFAMWREETRALSLSPSLDRALPIFQTAILQPCAQGRGGSTELQRLDNLDI